MAEVASAYVSLLPSAKGFGTRMTSDLKGEVNRSGTVLGRGFGKVFAAVAVLGLASKLGGFFKDSIAEAREAQKVGAITEQIIKATGGAAKVTASQVADLANAISLKTGKDDEAIQTGANLLLTFKNVRNEVGKGNKIFDQATQAAVDLSAAGFGSIDSASKQLGKALQDPIKGLTALARAGVTFTAQQTERIKGLIAEGEILKAQKIILGEVQSQVGGVAEASATAGEKAAVAWANLKEQLGTALLPVVDKLATVFTNSIVPAISEFVSGMQSGTGAGGQFASILSKIWEATKQVASFLIETFKPSWDQLVKTFQENKEEIGQVVGFFLKAQATGLALAAVIISKILPPLIRFGGFLIGTLVPAIARFITYNRESVASLIAFGRAIVDRVKDAAKFTAGVIAKFQEAVAFMKTVPGKMVKALGDLGHRLLTAGLQVMQGFAQGIKDGASMVINAITNAVNDAINWGLGLLGIASPSKVFADMGIQTMAGLAEGIQSGQVVVTDRLVSALTDLRAKAKEHLAALRAEFTSLADSIATAFTPDLFQATSLSDFLNQGSAAFSQLVGLRKAFKKLKGWGLDPQFLAQLFASGNAALILDMAEGSRRDARQASGIFADIGSLTQSLGRDVARDVIGPRIDRTNQKLDGIKDAIDAMPRRFAREMNGVASDAKVRAA